MTLATDTLNTCCRESLLYDLEPLLEQLYLDGNHDAEGAIMRFGHGDCHDLTIALHDKYQAPIIAIVGKDSGMPVHSCVLIDDNTTLDAYGINTLEKTLERYSKLSMVNLKEPAISKIVDIDWVCTFASGIDDEPDDVLADFQPIADLLKVNITSLFTNK